MKNVKLLQCIIVCAVLLYPLNCIAAVNPEDILTRVRDRYDGNDYISNVVLRITDKTGKTRERHMYMLQKDMENIENVMLLFNWPADVRGVGFMMTTYQEASGKPDDQWMYFPAFRKIRRIASQDKRGAFMGSDFAYTDLDKIRVHEFTSDLAGEQRIGDRPVWVIDRVPVSQEIINKTGYYRLRLYVDKERDIVLRQDYYNIKGVKFKEQQAAKIEKIENIWTVMHAVMKDLEDGSVSDMIFQKVDYNVGLESNLFSHRILKRGIDEATFRRYADGG